MKEQTENFETLKQLLKVKRHEVPPPGYFNGFSDQVISRIRAGEAGAGSATVIERLEFDAPWLANFLRLFDARPGVLGALATSVCVLLMLTVVFAEKSDESAKHIFPISEPAASGTAATTSAMPPLLAASESSGIMASTNPVTSLQPAATMFGQQAGNPLFQSASFAPAGPGQ